MLPHLRMIRIGRNTEDSIVVTVVVEHDLLHEEHRGIP